ncbi:hypothetical protein RFM68_09760 [Mesorhizobium sp. MSK_1335]|uniref:Lipoprotein n=1 Tax=Mesorhizobium montanum TaxID=3072323 RepID=A0ABU4ZHJ3_9HYPH|nr:hypothetical protein [Mesorhizobium sp. MSK_1335]MDX8524795.1 hypothetical protein [Mesorhizobium sp. MSK_1335]
MACVTATLHVASACAGHADPSVTLNMHIFCQDSRKAPPQRLTRP